MIRNLAILVAACLAGTALAQATADAQKSGEAWLSLVDHQKYAESWTGASSFFRMSIPQKQWVTMVRAVRGPLGMLKSRTVQSATEAKTLPGVPDGDYVVIVYQTSYQNKASAIETLTLMKDGREWRPAGYFIR